MQKRAHVDYAPMFFFLAKPRFGGVYLLFSQMAGFFD